ncbi:ribonucleoside-triphosphate reductase, adenosylcobalamin-dependent [Sinorhizobium meliloti]|uniref:ribonucleoside-triphosphate reductase, adenosylcobalamin-dependent n=1 Tax=Rhizobium meliloti TaxID=382 RepID=UPI00129700E6|nr:ribonucleoside-triphosphate reductase, adenosylcobalamin-dependent [Sinorhizobium meliloti]MDW9491762.1 ribonucleoside-triphosphate reductase, adenosylcobalamin-dependent [Sinorhizobium meliloti]MQV03028.1 ribonucleoside-triphosphate reductase, adenosylcobalamin-dependent [Sinorhizobium meliloti]
MTANVLEAAKGSIRSQIVERRTYLRPLDDEGTIFETFEQSVDRMIEHQRWLWERAKAGMHRDPATDQWVLDPLVAKEEVELEELRSLLLQRKVTLAGRTRWLGGTDIAKRRESSMFNCSFLEVRSVYDVVDVLWLLLQGCGVGFRPIVGVLNGFNNPIPEIEVIRSTRVGKSGDDRNKETFVKKTGVWTIKVGDSAEAWAKSIGKLLAGKKPAKKLVLDFSEIRPAGERLKGYGWISSGDEQIAKAFEAIARILSNAAGRLLTRIEILDIINWLGTVLSSRRSAEICLMAVGEPEWKEFATAKRNWFDFYNTQGEVFPIPAGLNKFDKKDKAEIERLANAAGFYDRAQRQQSNNTLMFYHRPERWEVEYIFDLMVAAGGSEPGFSNALEALRRAPWFKGGNPCYEILLGDRSFCNLVETVLFRFNGDPAGLLRAHYLVARANYRQTCVWLDDGILQRGWHELNEYLRLCGVGVTGVVSWNLNKDAQAWRYLRDSAQDGAHSMADELGMPRAKAVTTIKPSGTQSKTLSLAGHEVPEGIHKPLGRYIFNNVGMSAHDPLIPMLKKAGYLVFPKPSDPSTLLVRIPVEYSNIEFDKVKRIIKRQENRYLGHGDFDPVEYEEEVEVEVNLESAIDQLERYKLVMENYVDHNCSITVSYDPSEVPAIIDWFMNNWDCFVGVSFLYRNDPSKTAEDLGYAYLPQEVVDKETFRAYEAQLLPIDWTGTETELSVENAGEECIGACPVR